MSAVVLGVGIDLCELDRIDALLARFGPAFLRRAYTPGEIEYITGSGDRGRRCAGLFAAKEAVVKCLGTGFSCGVGWKQVELVPDGKALATGWTVRLYGAAGQRESVHAASRWRVSIQYNHEHAIATAIWTGQAGG